MILVLVAGGNMYLVHARWLGHYCRKRKTNGVFKPPNSVLGFPNFITLRLEGTTFVPAASFCIIKFPLLANLGLILCRGTQYLNIVSLVPS